MMKLSLNIDSRPYYAPSIYYRTYRECNGRKTLKSHISIWLGFLIIAGVELTMFKWVDAIDEYVKSTFQSAKDEFFRSIESYSEREDRISGEKRGHPKPPFGC